MPNLDFLSTVHPNLAAVIQQLDDRSQGLNAAQQNVISWINTQMFTLDDKNTQIAALQNEIATLQPPT